MLKLLVYILILAISAFELSTEYGISFGQEGSIVPQGSIQPTQSLTDEGSTVTSNTQNLNNLDQAQLVDLIASTISDANNVDKLKIVQVINESAEKTKAKGANVIDSLKRMAGVVLNDPTGKVAKSFIQAALQGQTSTPQINIPPQTSIPQGLVETLDKDQETTSEQFSTYTNEKYGITMQYPSDWTKDEGEGEGEDYEDIEIVKFSKDIDEFKGDVVLYFVAGDGVSLSEYLSNTIEAYEDAGDFDLLSSSANSGQKLSGNPAYILEYKDDSLELRYLEIGTKIGNDYYYVEYYADTDDRYFQSLPIVQKMIDSIKIGSAATSTLSSQ
jgi:hypothetical protein